MFFSVLSVLFKNGSNKSQVDAVKSKQTHLNEFRIQFLFLTRALNKLDSIVLRIPVEITLKERFVPRSGFTHHLAACLYGDLWFVEYMRWNQRRHSWIWDDCMGSTVCRLGMNHRS